MTDQRKEVQAGSFQPWIKWGSLRMHLGSQPPWQEGLVVSLIHKGPGKERFLQLGPEAPFLSPLKDSEGSGRRQEGPSRADGQIRETALSPQTSDSGAHTETPRGLEVGRLCSSRATRLRGTLGNTSGGSESPRGTRPNRRK